MTSVPEKVRIQNGLDSRKLQEMSSHFQQLLDACRGRLQETETQLNYILTLVQKSWHGDVEAIEYLSEIVGTPTPTIQPSPQLIATTNATSYRLPAKHETRPKSGQHAKQSGSGNHGTTMDNDTSEQQKALNTGRGACDLDQFRHLQSRLLFFNSVEREHDIIMQQDAAHVTLRARPYSATNGRPKSRLGLNCRNRGPRGEAFKPHVSVGELLKTIYQGSPLDAVTTDHSPGNHELRDMKHQEDVEARITHSPQFDTSAEKGLYQPPDLNGNDAQSGLDTRPRSRQFRVGSAASSHSQTNKPPVKRILTPSSRKLYDTRSAGVTSPQPTFAINSGYGQTARSRASSAKYRPTKEYVLAPTTMNAPSSNFTQELHSNRSTLSRASSGDDINDASMETYKSGGRSRPKSGKASLNKQHFNPLPVSVHHFSEDEQKMRQQERSLEQSIYELQKKLNINDEGLVLP